MIGILELLGIFFIMIQKTILGLVALITSISAFLIVAGIYTIIF